MGYLVYCAVTLLVVVMTTLGMFIWPKFRKFFLLASVINLAQNVVVSVVILVRLWG